MTKNDIITYVMKTPHNTNKAVLNSMLNELSTDGGGGTTTFTLHIVKGDGVAVINISGCMGTENGSVYTDKIRETADIIVLPYSGKALVYVDAIASTLGDVVSADIDGDIEALPTDNVYLMTGNATIELTAETPQS